MNFNIAKRNHMSLKNMKTIKYSEWNLARLSNKEKKSVQIITEKKRRAASW